MNRYGGLTYFTITLLLTLGLISACSTTPGSPKAIAKEKAAIKKSQESAIKANLKNMPDWMTKPPQSADAIFTSGSALSKDMQLAMDKAALSARRELALAVGGRVSTMMKQYAEESGVSENPDVMREVQRTTAEEAIDISLTGQRRSDAKVVKEGVSYRAYVLVRYPLGELNKLALKKVRENAVLDAKFRSSKAFGELEQKVQESRN